MVYNMADVGKRIEHLIKERGYKKSNICSLDANGNINEQKHLNFTRPTLNKIINGTKELSFNEMLEICNFFDVSLDYLLGESDYSNREAEAAGEYLGFSPGSIETIHNNAKLFQIMDFLLYYNKNAFLSFVHNLNTLVESSVTKDTGMMIKEIMTTDGLSLTALDFKDKINGEAEYYKIRFQINDDMLLLSKVEPTYYIGFMSRNNPNPES